MMRSLYSGVAGLKTHQTKMDVIGNNIANVNTVSYKSQSVTFNTLLYQTTQTASGANQETGMGGKNAKQIGLGSKTGAISTQIDQAGSAQTTNNPFDIMITGDSFFIVNNGTSNYFTRDGSFYVDGAGNLCMSSTGYNVMGWQVDDETQTIRQDRVSALKIMDAAKMTYDAEATTEAYVSGIVDANDSNINSTSGKVISLLVYDKLGYQYSAKFSMHATADKNAYYMKLEDVLDQNGDSLYEQYKGQTGVASIHDLVGWGSTQAIDTSDVVTLSSQKANAYTTKGQIDLKDTTTITLPVTDMTADPTTGTPTKYVYNKGAVTAGSDVEKLLKNAYNLDDDTIASIREFEIDYETAELTITKRQVTNSVLVSYDAGTGTFKDLTGDGTSAGVAKLDFNTDVMKMFADINVDFTASRQANNNKAATISATNGNLKGNYAGRKIGDMSGVTIAQDGKIYATYDNGCSRLLGQIAVANFANASGLSLEGDNLYAETQNSGAFDGVGSDITGGGGYMTTGELEMSNVDLSSEFTEMITTQRGFQANSRIITVSDTMLEELTNLKR